MRDKARRTELGKMCVDIAKYVYTIVVIGGLFSERVNIGAIVLGFVLATAVAAIGFHVIPLEEDRG